MQNLSLDLPKIKNKQKTEAILSNSSKHLTLEKLATPSPHCVHPHTINSSTYNSAHLRERLTRITGHSTERMASSKTVFKPFCVNAEHSRYLTAPISLAIAKPCGYVMGVSFFSFNFSMVALSSRKSSFVPTNMIGTLGQ
uniref:Uncharacterized protein n=1 Tax=Bactrocera dorsalis TaxID=27457 RepID=A0A034W3Y8_BACDO